MNSAARPISPWSTSRNIRALPAGSASIRSSTRAPSPCRRSCATSGAAASAACTSLFDGSAELLEAEALETSPLVGKPLREIGISKGIRFGAIVRGTKVIPPTGDVRIEAGDFVIVMALSEAVRKVEQMFRVSIDFF